jgi:hypothetical protein
MAEIIEQSPIVSHLSWGEMSIEGVGIGCDFKLFPGGGRDWNWSETNTHHRPGIQIADVSELLENKCEVIVLSRGIQSRLQTCPDVFDFLSKKNIGVYVAETKAAVEVYNLFASRGIKVGGLFHSTC